MFFLSLELGVRVTRPDKLLRTNDPSKTQKLCKNETRKLTMEKFLQLSFARDLWWTYNIQFTVHRHPVSGTWNECTWDRPGSVHVTQWLFFQCPVFFLDGMFRIRSGVECDNWRAIFHSFRPSDKILEIESQLVFHHSSHDSSPSFFPCLFTSHCWLRAALVINWKQAFLAGVPFLPLLAPFALSECLWQAQLLSRIWRKWMIYRGTVEFMGQIQWFIVSLAVPSSTSSYTRMPISWCQLGEWLMHWKVKEE